MSVMRLTFEARNALGNPGPTTTAFQVSLDGGSFRSLTAKEVTGGLVVASGSKIEVMAEASGFYPVKQNHEVTSTAIVPLDPKDDHAHLISKGLVSGEHVFTFVAWVTLFREVDVANHGWPALKTSKETIVQYDDGAAVLAGRGEGWGRINGSRHEVTQHVSGSTGTVRYFEAASTFSSPKLVAVYVPNGLSLKSPVPMSMFCLPFPKDETPYPWAEYYQGRIDYYLVTWYHLLHQHTWKRKACFVFPMPNRGTYFANIQSASKLRRFLQELVFAFRTQMQGRPIPKLGRCAISGYSRGGSMVETIVKTSANGEFPELKEAWSLDGLAAKAIDKHAKKWLDSDDDRRLRVYVGYYEDLAGLTPSFVSGSPTVSGAAKEWHTKRSTYLFAPKEFWRLIAAEEEAAKRYAGPDVSTTMSKEWTHQTIVKLMLTHAIASSGF